MAQDQRDTVHQRWVILRCFVALFAWIVRLDYRTLVALRDCYSKTALCQSCNSASLDATSGDVVFDVTSVPRAIRMPENTAYRPYAQTPRMEVIPTCSPSGTLPVVLNSASYAAASFALCELWEVTHEHTTALFAMKPQNPRGLLKAMLTEAEPFSRYVGLLSPLYWC